MAKRTNNDLQNITQKTKDRATRTPLKTMGELMCSRRVSSFCSTTRRLVINTEFLLAFYKSISKMRVF
jgi:hypothetical protein